MSKYNIPRLLEKKGTQKVICMTAYEVFSAQLLNESAVDLILVGDSLGHVIQGKQSTVPVTLEEMIYHCTIVSQNAPTKTVIGDLPFGAVGISVQETVKNCVRLFKESGIQAVKMEGASEIILESIRRLLDLGVPVMGHIGLQPQSVNVYGGYKVQGRTDEIGKQLLEQAHALAQAGVFGMVLECVVEKVALQITEEIPSLTIGIGSGQYTDGQVLVTQDVLGMLPGRVPSFVRKYANIFQSAQEAIGAWMADVKSGEYPSVKERYE